MSGHGLQDFGTSACLPPITLLAPGLANRCEMVVALSRLCVAAGVTFSMETSR